jgi:small subunit ribosomal protein S1
MKATRRSEAASSAAVTESAEPAQHGTLGSLGVGARSEEADDWEQGSPRDESGGPAGDSGRTPGKAKQGGSRERLAELLESARYRPRPVRRGEIREAQVIRLSEDEVVVDLRSKRDGFVPPRDLEMLGDEYREGLQVGDLVPVLVLKTWGQGGRVVVSLNKGLQRQDWLRAQELLDSEEVTEMEVVGTNRGGVLVRFGRLRGFVPNSLLTSVPRGLRGERRRKAKEELIGQQLGLVVIEVKQRRRRLVLSQKAARRQQGEKLLRELTEGEVRTGVVRSLVEFGAFVDLGGMDGLIHISELDWTHVDRPGDVLSVGEEVEVYVLSVDRDRERIGLSRKRLLPDPWLRVTERLRAGDQVEGTVTGLEQFGAFVDVGEGVEGLVHVSEMPEREESLGALKAGDVVTVRVLSVDQWERQIALRLESPGVEGQEEGSNEGLAAPAAVA